MGKWNSDVSTGAVMSARIPESISPLLVEFTVRGNATPPRDPNDDDETRMKTKTATLKLTMNPIRQ
jgi:hypothetical protein